MLLARVDVLKFFFPNLKLGSIFSFVRRSIVLTRDISRTIWLIWVICLAAARTTWKWKPKWIQYGTTTKFPYCVYCSVIILIIIIDHSNIAACIHCSIECSCDERALINFNRVISCTICSVRESIYDMTLLARECFGSLISHLNCPN